LSSSSDRLASLSTTLSLESTRLSSAHLRLAQLIDDLQAETNALMQREQMVLKSERSLRRRSADGPRRGKIAENVSMTGAGQEGGEVKEKRLSEPGGVGIDQHGLRISGGEIEGEGSVGRVTIGAEGEEKRKKRGSWVGRLFGLGSSKKGKKS
jgi:hypothetical protein